MKLRWGTKNVRAGAVGTGRACSPAAPAERSPMRWGWHMTAAFLYALFLAVVLLVDLVPMLAASLEAAP